MGILTDIEWCDSSLNLMMGCDGCELWNPKKGIKHCYAGVLTERYGGAKGWPASFDQPTTFPERLKAALRWPDLTGTERPKKPWLNGHPRMIFLDDMGDTFTESLPLEWTLPHIPAMEASTHCFMFLTKRARRMRMFFEQLGRVPRNFWLMTSVTTNQTIPRVRELLRTGTAQTIRGISYESALGQIEHIPGLFKGYCPTHDFPGGFCNGGCDLDQRLSLVIIGGESGPGARPFNVRWARDTIAECRAAGVKAFCKQLGARPYEINGYVSEWPAGTALRFGEDLRVEFTLKDRKGGDMSEWPEDLRVRQFPKVPR